MLVDAPLAVVNAFSELIIRLFQLFNQMVYFSDLVCEGCLGDEGVVFGVLQRVVQHRLELVELSLELLFGREGGHQQVEVQNLRIDVLVVLVDDLLELRQGARLENEQFVLHLLNVVSQHISVLLQCAQLLALPPHHIVEPGNLVDLTLEESHAVLVLGDEPL